MALASKTRNIFEGLVNEGSFKWFLGKRSFFDEEFEEVESPPSPRHCIEDLSPIANTVVRKCSK